MSDYIGYISIYISICSHYTNAQVFHLVEPLRDRFKGAEICTQVEYWHEGEHDEKPLINSIIVTDISKFFQVKDFSDSEHLEFLAQMAEQFDEDDNVEVKIVWDQWDDDEERVDSIGRNYENGEWVPALV